MDDSRNVTQDCQKNIDQEWAGATSFKEHAQWREENGQDDLKDVWTSKSHGEFQVLIEVVKLSTIDKFCDKI